MNMLIDLHKLLTSNISLFMYLRLSLQNPKNLKVLTLFIPEYMLFSKVESEAKQTNKIWVENSGYSSLRMTRSYMIARKYKPNTI